MTENVEVVVKVPKDLYSKIAEIAENPGEYLAGLAEADVYARRKLGDRELVDAVRDVLRGEIESWCDTFLAPTVDTMVDNLLLSLSESGAAHVASVRIPVPSTEDLTGSLDARARLVDEYRDRSSKI